MTNALGAEQFLAALVRTSSDAIMGKTADGIVVFWNDAAEQLYGYTADEMLGHDIAILFPPDRPGELAELLARVRSGETIREFHTRRLRKNGTTVEVSITMAPVLNETSEVFGISVIARDLTFSKLQIEDLRDAHRRATEMVSTIETLHASAPIGLGFIDRNFRYVHLNETLAAFDGTSPTLAIGKTVEEVVPNIWKQVEPHYRHVLEHDEAVLNVEVPIELASDPGRLHHWLASYYPVHVEEDVIGIGLVVIDVTESRRAEEFRTSVIKNMAEGLMTVDVEGRLTSMNDAATKMLGWTEEELRGVVLGPVILPRYPNIDTFEEGAAQLLRVRSEGISVRLNDAEYVCKNGSRLAVAISASPLLSGTVVEGAVVLFRDVTEERSERLRVSREIEALTWVGRIREALDEGRFVLYSQPIIPLKGGRASEELLIRMVGRDGEIIEPGSFLGVAEKYGMITEIDRWVIRQGIRIAAGDRHVGINLSAESVVTSDLLAFIEREITDAGTDPANLVFEITETALMHDIEKARSFVKGVTQLGCSVALDDFGTGFGTFTHLKKLNVSYLKIDMEFVRGLVNSPENQHVVKAIVNLARGFNCGTVAEGVEDGSVLAMLKDLDVDYAQGFHLGRPTPL
ncbi:MAG: EAL domain-containing protein [Acidimicrobiales bacterium]